MSPKERGKIKPEKCFGRKEAIPLQIWIHHRPKFQALRSQEHHRHRWRLGRSHRTSLRWLLARCCQLRGHLLLGQEGGHHFPVVFGVFGCCFSQCTLVYVCGARVCGAWCVHSLVVGGSGMCLDRFQKASML